MPARKPEAPEEPEYIVANVGGNYPSERYGEEIRFEAGDVITGPYAEQLVNFGFAQRVSPAAAGSSQPGDNDGSAQ